MIEVARYPLIACLLRTLHQRGNRVPITCRKRIAPTDPEPVDPGPHPIRDAGLSFAARPLARVLPMLVVATARFPRLLRAITAPSIRITRGLRA